MAPTVRTIAPGDRAGWEPLWVGYLTFYGAAVAPEVTDHTWKRLVGADTSIGGFVAVHGEQLVGFTHYVLHPTTWTVGPACYLEDLFVTQARRGAGVGYALITHLAEVGRQRNWSGVHWITGSDNATGMRLYDRVARRTSWVRYEMDLV